MSSEEYKKILQRRTLRGVKRCEKCGIYNGTRSEYCKNKECPMARPKVAKKYIAPQTFELVSKVDAKLFSVQVRDRCAQQRNFVQITDKTIASDDDGCIISRNAICFVDTCKYDSHDINISCKHVKSALEHTELAEALDIDRDVWQSMDIGTEAKERLWNAYTDAQTIIPMVQRIKNMFVVKCEMNSMFPAGRLHVFLNTKGKTASGSYSCGCKKLKISMTPNNSIIMENDKCEHVYLVIAAILSSTALTEDFKEFLNVVQNTFKHALQPQQDKTLFVTEDFINFSENVLNDCITLSKPDACSTKPTLFGQFNDIVTCDTIANSEDILNNIELIQVPTTTATDSPVIDGSSINIVNNNDNVTDDLHSLELIDCQIELMDQFKLTDHIDLQLNEQDIFGSENIFPTSTQQTSSLAELIETSELVTNHQEIVNIKPFKRKRKRSLNRRDEEEHAAMVKRIPDDEDAITYTLSFNTWLESVIESINLCMDFNDDGNPDKLVFIVSHGFFNNLKMRFSTGRKLRLPSTSKIIENGRYQGLSIHTWKFINLNLLKMIFTTNSIALQPERTFSKMINGVYKHIDYESTFNNIENGLYRKIKPTKFSTFLKLRSANNNNNSCDDDIFQIEWIPNVLRKSAHGEMRISFKFGHKRNDIIISNQSKLS